MNDRALDRLFRRFRDRADGAALAVLFDATARELLGVACHLHRDASEAEDLVQATFVAAIRSAQRYDGSAPVKAWLYGILWREAQRARRTAARAVDPARLAERREPEPLELLAARELPAAVERALGRLPRRYREVLDPLLREGRSAEDIARDLQRSPGTVRSQIHRGLERLRRALPDGLAPASGLAAVSVRGLAAVRGEVLRAAGFSPSVAAAASAAALNVSLGALLMSKATLIGAAAALAAAGALWIARTGAPLPAGGRRAAAPEAAAVARGPETAGRAAPDAGGARAEVPVERPVEGAAAPAPGRAEEPGADVERWLARFNEAPDDWRHGLEIASQIAELPPDEALAVMRGVWPHLSVPVKEQALKPFVFDGGRPHALKVLDLAATDPSLSVQGRAFIYLKSYAFQDFSTDYDAYLAWAATYRDLQVKDVLALSAKGLVGDLLALPPDALAERVRALGRLDLAAGAGAGVDLAAVMRDAGGLQALAACMQAQDPEAQELALAWSKTLAADEAWLRTWVLPALEDPASVEAGVLDAGFGALGRPDCAWAEEPLCAYLRRASALDPAEALPGAADAASALADIGDPAAIPALIEILLADRSGRLGYDVGYFGLSKLTGVTWQESYDGAWWLAWWEKNAARLPPEVRSIAIRR